MSSKLFRLLFCETLGSSVRGWENSEIFLRIVMFCCGEEEGSCDLITLN
uniref:Uncharacterized protein n=1 Tax=Populus trichocarpa TaxID=3694 RepID=A0A3N7EMQ3_POPTR